MENAENEIDSIHNNAMAEIERIFNQTEHNHEIIDDLVSNDLSHIMDNESFNLLNFLLIVILCFKVL